jgi:hypothetical protein
MKEYIKLYFALLKFACDNDWLFKTPRKWRWNAFHGLFRG